MSEHEESVLRSQTILLMVRNNKNKNIIKNRKIEQETAKRIKDIEGSKEFSNLVKEMKKRNLNIKDFLKQMRL